MKKTLLFFLIVISFCACKKEADSSIQRLDVTAIVAVDEEYRFKLKKYTKNGEFPLITTPPSKYRVSRINYSSTEEGASYQYLSNLPLGGSDKVIIKIVREHEHDPLIMAYY